MFAKLKMASHRCVLLSLTAGGILLASTTCGVAEEKYALLVGCSEYQNPKISPLPGVVNDIETMEDLLRTALGFENITTLVGWPEAERERPTYQNIEAAFENLILNAKSGSQVVILFAGHGVSVPLPSHQVDLLDPENPEPDGLDEAFVPADATFGKSLILDNQIGYWLDQLSENGSHVWIIFDSCFSATMTRSASSDVMRSVDPSLVRAVGKNDSKVESGLRRPTEIVDQAFEHSETSTKSGSVVAFYAAQDFEKAPEVTRPLGADANDPRNKHGLLSYHLVQELKDRESTITYRDLGRALVNRYRADGRRRPTPYWDGDLDREVLGVKKWPKKSPLVFENNDGKPRLLGGSLAGLQVGTIVSVHAAHDKDLQHPLGYVGVTLTHPTAAEVVAVAFNGNSATDITMLPHHGHCQIVSHSVEIPALKLAVVRLDSSVEEEIHSKLQNSVRDFAVQPNSILTYVENIHDSEWIVTPISNAIADEIPGQGDSTLAVILMPTDVAIEFSEDKEITDRDFSTNLMQAPHAVFRQDVKTDSVNLLKHLNNEVLKIRRWNNIWAVAQEYGATSEYVDQHSVILNANKLNKKGVENLPNALSLGDSVQLNVTNAGYENCWYVVLYLSGRYGIHHICTEAIRGKKGLEQESSEEVLKFEVQKDSIGSNGFVLIAIPQSEHPNRPEYSALAQEPLGKRTRAAQELFEPISPFEELLAEAFDGERQNLRSSYSKENPQISSWSWVTRPIATPHGGQAP